MGKVGDVLDTQNETNQERNGFDRRSFLRRSAVVGAATAWATPTVQSVMAPAFAIGTPSGGCTACLTGGGKIVGTVAMPVLYNGLAIPFLTFGLSGPAHQGGICCDGDGPVEIEVNAHTTGGQQGDISWHFRVNLALTCEKTGSPAPPPITEECANRFTGTVDQVDANGDVTATLSFVFQDNGEGQGGPDGGENIDFVSISIVSFNGQGTLSGTGMLEKGNLQVHEGFGPAIHRDCTGC